MSKVTSRESELLKLYMDNDLEVEDLIKMIVDLEEKIQQYDKLDQEKNKVAKEHSDSVAEKFFEFCKGKSLPRIIEEHRRTNTK